ncbi:MAG: hypothetical protein E7678_05185 [Ruminococcaceae bacterium]|nr:hypothetical protein [Oscillospiraceae bacterium]
MHRSKIKIKIGFASALLLISLLISRSPLTLAALGAAFIHEAGHLLMAKVLGLRLSEVKLSLWGAGIKPLCGITSYTDEVLLCAAGPFINLLSFFIILPLKPTENSFCQLFALSSLLLGALNLIPISDFDGGRILNALLCVFLSPSSVALIMKAVSFIFIFSLWGLSLYLLLKNASSLSLFVFSVAMFMKIFISDIN